MNKNLCLWLMLAFAAVSCGNNKDRNIIQEEIVDASLEVVNADERAEDSVNVKSDIVKDSESKPLQTVTEGQNGDSVLAIATKTATIDFVVPPGKVMKSLDLGTIEAGKEGFGTMCLTNTGTDTIWVSNVVMSNPKLHGKISYNKLGPGVIVGLMVTVDKDMSVGKFEESATIYFKDIESPKILPITGTVE